MKKNEKNETKAHYLSIETKISIIRHKQHFEIILNLGLGMVAKMVNIKIFNIIFWSKFGLKRVIKLILIKFTHLYLFIYNFKIKIQWWKYVTKHQNNNYGYGCEAFSKNPNVFLSYSIKTQCFTMIPSPPHFQKYS